MAPLLPGTLVAQVHQANSLLPYSAVAFIDNRPVPISENLLPPSPPPHTQFTTEKTLLFRPDKRHFQLLLTDANTLIQSRFLDPDGKPSASNRNAYVGRQERFLGFAIDEPGLFGVAITTNHRLLLFEAYENPHHFGPIADVSTMKVTSELQSLLWITWAVGPNKDSGIVGTITKRNTFAIYRVSPLAIHGRENYLDWVQKSIASRQTHLLTDEMMIHNRQMAKKWQLVAELPIEAAYWYTNYNLIPQ